MQNILRTSAVGQMLVATLIFLGGLMLHSASYLPTYNELNFIDEILYLSTGKNLIDGVWWHYSRGPLISFVYAVIYPFANLSENWVLTSAVIGRFLTYCLYFLMAWLIGRELQFRRLSHPLIMIAALAVVPPYLVIITNPSYALFTVSAGFSFWKLLTYMRTCQTREVVLAGVFIGCALLARPDFVMGAIFALTVWFTTAFLRSYPKRIRTLLFAAAPAVLMVVGYVQLYGLKTGEYHFGASGKMYNTFEAAQQILADTDGMFDFDAATKGKEESEKYFGTAEENNHSVIRAIMKNPARFAELVWVNTIDRTIPLLSVSYGGRPKTDTPLLLLSGLVGVFTLCGLITLIRGNHWGLLTIAALWLGQIVVYLITISFPGYLQFPFYVVFMLVAIGLHSLTARFSNPAVALGILMLGIAALNLPNTLRLNWPGPKSGYEEQAAFLQARFPERTPTISFSCPAAILAKMDWRGIGIEVKNIRSQNDFRHYLEAQHIKVVLIDPMLTSQNIFGWYTLLQKYSKGYLKQIWQSQDGQFKVLVTSDMP